MFNQEELEARLLGMLHTLPKNALGAFNAACSAAMLRYLQRPYTGNLARKPLGRLTRSPEVCTPKLASVAPALAPALPSYTTIADTVHTWLMSGNDIYNDCTCAFISNYILGATSATGTPVVMSVADVLATYQKLLGPVIAGTANDHGATLTDMLTLWNMHGVQANIDHLDKIDAFAELDVKNIDQVKQAISQIGPISIGLELPSGWQTSNFWDANAGEIEGGHCVAVVGYDAVGPIYISWGAAYHGTWAGWQQYIDEAYVIINKDTMLASGKNIDGLDWQAIENAMVFFKEQR